MTVKVLAEASRRRCASRNCGEDARYSQKMLSVTLQGMTRDGLVDRRVEPSVPPRVHYRLTPLGLSLEGPLAMVRAWAEERIGRGGPSQRARPRTRRRRLTVRAAAAGEGDPPWTPRSREVPEGTRT